jgi:hypothetical protein
VFHVDAEQQRFVPNNEWKLEEQMRDRRVTHTGKDSKGDITSLGNPGEWWSPRGKQDAIQDIETGANTYYVIWPPGQTRSEVRVVHGSAGKYLRTDRDNTTRNNLEDLPNC